MREEGCGEKMRRKGCGGKLRWDIWGEVEW